MIVLFAIAIPGIALATWLYLRFGPAGTTVRSRLGFEVPILTAAILGCVGAIYYSYLTVGQGTDSAWWPVIAFIYCCILIPTILIIAAITRRLIYRNSTDPT